MSKHKNTPHTAQQGRQPQDVEMSIPPSAVVTEQEKLLLQTTDAVINATINKRLGLIQERIRQMGQNGDVTTRDIISADLQTTENLFQAILKLGVDRIISDRQALIMRLNSADAKAVKTSAPQGGEGAGVAP